MTTVSMYKIITSKEIHRFAAAAFFFTVCHKIYQHSAYCCNIMLSIVQIFFVLTPFAPKDLYWVCFQIRVQNVSLINIRISISFCEIYPLSESKGCQPSFFLICQFLKCHEESVISSKQTYHTQSGSTLRRHVLAWQPCLI